MTKTKLPLDHDMYQALLNRDEAFDGVFYFCVKTTGIFCRPVCTARKPRRENVEFVRTIREATLRGYRPCKVCEPSEHGQRHPDWALKLLRQTQEAQQTRLTDADLRKMGIEPARARRYFRDRFGMTFQAWQRAHRLGQAMVQLRTGDGIDAVGLDHGFDSSSGFREAFTRLFGDPPGKNEQIPFLLAKWLQTPLGPMVAAASQQGVCLLEFSDRRSIEKQIHRLRQQFRAVIVPGENEHLLQLERELSEYFSGNRSVFETPVDLRGSPFQQQVWQVLLQIPYGESTTYAEIAFQLGKSSASRAVGRANGDNKIAIVVPCHRVVRTGGDLCGYAGGLWRKRWLLDHERQARKVGNFAN